jgi:hypothetical protein
MLKTKVFCLLSCSVAVLCLISCKKEQPALRSLEEDCSCAKEVSADFKMEESGSSDFNGNRAETDTSLFYKYALFSANEVNAEYTWYLDSEEINNKNKFSQYYGEESINKTIKVTLVVKKKPNKICLPNDDGYDSVTKFFHVSNRNWVSLFELPFPESEGVYRVKEQHSNDSVDITFDLSTSSPFGSSGVAMILYIPDGKINYHIFKDSVVSLPSGIQYIGYRRFLFESIGHDVDIYRRNNKDVEFNFTSTNKEYYKDFKYKGRKL